MVVLGGGRFLMSEITPSNALQEKLFLTDGYDTKLRGKCIFLFRRNPRKAADSSDPGRDIGYGELTADILQVHGVTG